MIKGNKNQDELSTSHKAASDEAISQTFENIKDVGTVSGTPLIRPPTGKNNLLV